MPGTLASSVHQGCCSSLPSQRSDFSAHPHTLLSPTWASRWLLASRFPTKYFSFFVYKIGILIPAPNHFGEDSMR